MEFCEGGSLESIYKEVRKLGGRTGEKVLGKVAVGVLNGLTYLHGRKIIHRGKQVCPGQFLSKTIGIKTSSRHQTVQHSPLPQWPSQAMWFWRQRWIRHQRRCQHVHWHFLLHGPWANHGPVLYNHVRCLVSWGYPAWGCATPFPLPCRWHWNAAQVHAHRSFNLHCAPTYP